MIRPFLVWGLNLALGAAGGAVMLAQNNGAPISNDSHVTLAVAVSAAVGAVGITLWIAVKMTKVEDGIRYLSRSFDKLPCQTGKHCPEEER